MTLNLHRCHIKWSEWCTARFRGGRFERTYFDVRVFNPHAPSNRQSSLFSCYHKQELHAYKQRVRHASFTHLFFQLLEACLMPCYEFHLVLASLSPDILSPLLSHPGVPAPVVVIQLSHHLPLTGPSLNFTTFELILHSALLCIMSLFCSHTLLSTVQYNLNKNK